jgi:hypothetical protein
MGVNAKKHEKVVTVSRDGFFAEGQNSIKISIFCMCSEGFQNM